MGGGGTFCFTDFLQLQRVEMFFISGLDWLYLKKVKKNGSEKIIHQIKCILDVFKVPLMVYIKSSFQHYKKQI